MINEKNFFSENKKINVSNTSSLVNLKAELFKKKQDAIKSRSATTKEDFERVNSTKNVSNSKWNQKAIQLDQRVRGLIKSGQKVSSSKKDEESAIEKELQRSKANLERKSKLYEEKLRNAYESLMKKGESDDEQEDDDNLIDFERKIITASKEGLRLFDSEARGSSSSEPADEMVEYVDSFGRTRQCKRQELDQIEKFNEQELLRRKLDRDLSRELNNDLRDDRAEAKSSQYPDLYSNFIRPSTEQQPESESKDRHYQEMTKGEIREHGTSYYQFSLDEVKRKQQMNELEKLRNETVVQRRKADELVEKRNAGLKQRLLKLAKRKGLVVDDDELSDSEISEQMKLDQYIKKVPEAKSAIDEDDSDYLAGSKFDRSEKSVREWDKEKLDCFFIDKEGNKDGDSANEDMDKTERFVGKRNDRRNDSRPTSGRTEEEEGERNPEFAPPSDFHCSGRSKKFKAERSVEQKVDQFLDQFK